MPPLDDDDDNSDPPMRTLMCRLVERTALTTDIYRLVFRLEDDEPFDFLAGQYAQIEFVAPDGSKVERPYSIANSPSASRRDAVLEFHVRALEGSTSASIVSSHRLAIGDLLRIKGPHGTSGMIGLPRRPLLLIAGGTGLGPMLAIAEETAALGARQPVRLYVGARTAQDVYCESRIRALKTQHPDFRAEIVLSLLEASPQYRVGLVTDAVAHDLQELARFDVYMAGPPAMVESAGRLLLARGVDPRSIHSDDFKRIGG